MQLFRYIINYAHYHWYLQGPFVLAICQLLYCWMVLQWKTTIQSHDLPVALGGRLAATVQYAAG